MQTHTSLEHEPAANISLQSHSSDFSVGNAELAAPSRPDAQPPKPRANSFQPARFDLQKSNADAGINSSILTGSWKKANADVVACVADHLATPDRLSLSRTSKALRDMTPLGSKIPNNVLRAWHILLQGTNYQALDILLSHLPEASVQDKAAIVSEFDKHGLKANESPTLTHLGKLYEELESVSKNDTTAAIGLINNLFGYGIGNLPSGGQGDGLRRICDALKSISLEYISIGKVKNFAESKAKLDALGNALDTAIDKRSKMSQFGILSLDVQEITELVKLNTAAHFARDFALARQGKVSVLPDMYAKGVLKNITELISPQAKLMLANNLVVQFDQLHLDNPSEFLACLKACLETMSGKEATTSLIAKVDKLQKIKENPEASTV
jgi:hypothetical protein